MLEYYNGNDNRRREVVEGADAAYAAQQRAFYSPNGRLYTQLVEPKFYYYNGYKTSYNGVVHALTINDWCKWEFYGIEFPSEYHAIEYAFEKGFSFEDLAAYVKDVIGNKFIEIMPTMSGGWQLITANGMINYYADRKVYEIGNTGKIFYEFRKALMSISK